MVVIRVIWVVSSICCWGMWFIIVLVNSESSKLGKNCVMVICVSVVLLLFESFSMRYCCVVDCIYELISERSCEN